MNSEEIMQKKEVDIDYFDTLQGPETLKQNMFLHTELQMLRAQNQSLVKENDKLEKTLNFFKNVPAIIGEISEIYPEKKKGVIRTHNGIIFYVNMPDNFLKIANINDRVVMAQNNLAVLDVLPAEKDHRAHAFEVLEKPKVDFKDLGGLENPITEITETVILPLTNPELFEKFGIESPKGILLHGPPGTGKTMLAKAIANKTNSTFISVNGSELVQKFIGDGAKIVKDLFKLAKEKAPTIIFIDELDSIAAYRMETTTGADREVNRTMTQLLVEMDGFEKNDKIKIIAATNRIDILDTAVLRPGRFDRIVEIPLPNAEDRKKIFDIYLNKMPCAKLNLEEIVAKTKNASGAEIKSIATEAAIFAIRTKEDAVTQENINKAIDKVMGKEQEKPEIMYR